jgi:D-alanyl-D-alanine carboxypeptidase
VRSHGDAAWTPRKPRYAPSQFQLGDRSTALRVPEPHRLAYCELHSAEDRWTTTATLRPTAAWMAEQGCGPIEAMMSDNHKAYASHHFQNLLSELGARHITTPPNTPRWKALVS